MNQLDYMIHTAEYLAGLCGALLAAVITLVAVVPAFVEIARVRSPDFLSERVANKRLNLALNLLKYSIIVFGVGLLLPFIVMFVAAKSFLLTITIILTCLGIIIIVAAGYMIAATLRVDE